jgi:putative endonuclease
VYFVYIIQSECGRYYIGLTDDVERRVAQHNEGVSKWTKRYHNWHLVASWEFATLGEALKHEKGLKRQKGGNTFRRIVDETSGS